MERMERELELSPSQMKEVGKLLGKRGNLLHKQEKKGTTGEKREKKVLAANKKAQKKLGKILTDEQGEVYLYLRRELERARRGNKVKKDDELEF